MTTTIQPVLTELPAADYGFRAWRVQWISLANGNLGGAVDLVEFTDRSIQIEGTFGSGGTCVIQGSNDGGTNYETLRDPSSTSLSLTAAGLHGILEMTGLIRPNITAGDGTTSLTITMFMRRTFSR